MSYAYTNDKGKSIFAPSGGDFGLVERALAKQGRTPDARMYGINPSYRLDPNTYSGQAPPELSKQDREAGNTHWVNTGTRSYQTNDPATGSTNNRESIWSKIQLGGSKADAKDDSTSTDTATRQSFTPSPDLLAAREDAKTKAQDWQTASAATGSGLNLDPTSGDLYSRIHQSGSNQVDNYQRRFIPSLYATANLQALETGESSRYWLGQLDPAVKPPDVMSADDIFAQTKKYGRFVTNV
jgi:hypothetical protein